MAPNLCAGAYPLGKMAKALPARGEGWPRVLTAYKTPIFAKGQKLTHSPAHVEKHVGQETLLLYTPDLQWHHPGGRALLQLAQAPTQDNHSYTHALLGGVEDVDKSPGGSPVRLQENTELLSFCGLTGTPQRLPARAWREGVLLLRAQRICRRSRTPGPATGRGGVICLCDQRPCLAGQEKRKETLLHQSP